MLVCHCVQMCSCAIAPLTRTAPLLYRFQAGIGCIINVLRLNEKIIPASVISTLRADVEHCLTRAEQLNDTRHEIADATVQHSNCSVS